MRKYIEDNQTQVLVPILSGLLGGPWIFTVFYFHAYSLLGVGLTILTPFILGSFIHKKSFFKLLYRASIFKYKIKTLKQKQNIWGQICFYIIKMDSPNYLPDYFLNDKQDLNSTLKFYETLDSSFLDEYQPEWEDIVELVFVRESKLSLLSISKLEDEYPRLIWQIKQMIKSQTYIQSKINYQFHHFINSGDVL